MPRTVRSSRWLRRFQPADTARVRLVCFPHAGGAASFFGAWPDALVPEIELLAVRYPGREDRIDEPCVETMEEMAGTLAEQLAPLLGDGLAFFGHSMGAAIAFEVALRLERYHGVGPEVLFLSGRGSPGSKRRPEINGDEEIIRRVASLGHGNDSVFADSSMRDLVMPALRSDHRLLDSFFPPPDRRTGSSIVAYTGDSDPEVEIGEVADWERATRGEFELKVFGGGHFYLIERRDEVIRDIADRLVPRGTG